MKYLVDTNIIIYHLAGEQKATDFIAQYLHEIAISFISYIEILSYPFDKKQEEDIRKFLEKIHMITISKEIIEEAIRLRKEKISCQIVLSLLQRVLKN